MVINYYIYPDNHKNNIKNEENDDFRAMFYVPFREAGSIALHCQKH